MMKAIASAQGAVIAVLDDSDLRLARDRAKATLDVAEANRAHARVEEDRAASLLKTGGITDKDRLAAQVAVQVAEASHAQARTELAIAEQQLARTQVKAPLAGRIAKRMADAGTMLAVGSPIFEIVDDGVFEFRASVASSDFAKVRVGEDVTVTVDALPGFSAKGQVTRIVPIVDARSRSFEVVVRIPGQPQLVSGLFARADIHVRDVPGSLTVPPAALVRDGADPTPGPGIRGDRRQGRSARCHRGRRAARCRAGDERPAGRRGRGGRSACGARSRHSRGSPGRDSDDRRRFMNHAGSSSCF